MNSERTTNINKLDSSRIMNKTISTKHDYLSQSMPKLKLINNNQNENNFGGSIKIKSSSNVTAEEMLKANFNRANNYHCNNKIFQVFKKENNNYKIIPKVIDDKIQKLALNYSEIIATDTVINSLKHGITQHKSSIKSNKINTSCDFSFDHEKALKEIEKREVKVLNDKSFDLNALKNPTQEKLFKKEIVKDTYNKLLIINKLDKKNDDIKKVSSKLTANTFREFVINSSVNKNDYFEIDAINYNKILNINKNSVKLSNNDEGNIKIKGNLELKEILNMENLRFFKNEIDLNVAEYPYKNTYIVEKDELLSVILNEEYIKFDTVEEKQYYLDDIHFKVLNLKNWEKTLPEFSQYKVQDFPSVYFSKYKNVTNDRNYLFLNYIQEKNSNLKKIAQHISDLKASKLSYDNTVLLLHSLCYFKKQFNFDIFKDKKDTIKNIDSQRNFEDNTSKRRIKINDENGQIINIDINFGNTIFKILNFEINQEAINNYDKRLFDIVSKEREQFDNFLKNEQFDIMNTFYKMNIEILTYDEKILEIIDHIFQLSEDYENQKDELIQFIDQSNEYSNQLFTKMTTVLNDDKFRKSINKLYSFFKNSILSFESKLETLKEEYDTNRKNSKEILKELNQKRSEIKLFLIDLETFIDRIRNYSKVYYLEILKSGVDVRKEGISWVVCKLLEADCILEISNFPVFIKPEQLEYIINISKHNILCQQYSIIYDHLKELIIKNKLSDRNKHIKEENQAELNYIERISKTYEKNKQDSNRKFKMLSQKIINSIKIEQLKNSDDKDLDSAKETIEKFKLNNDQKFIDKIESINNENHFKLLKDKNTLSSSLRNHRANNELNVAISEVSSESEKKENEEREEIDEIDENLKNEEKEYTERSNIDIRNSKTVKPNLTSKYSFAKDVKINTNDSKNKEKNDKIKEQSKFKKKFKIKFENHQEKEDYLFSIEKAKKDMKELYNSLSESQLNDFKNTNEVVYNNFMFKQRNKIEFKSIKDKNTFDKKYSCIRKSNVLVNLNNKSKLDILLERIQTANMDDDKFIKEVLFYKNKIKQYFENYEKNKIEKEEIMKKAKPKIPYYNPNGIYGCYVVKRTFIKDNKPTYKFELIYDYKKQKMEKDILEKKIYVKSSDKEIKNIENSNSNYYEMDKNKKKVNFTEKINKKDISLEKDKLMKQNKSDVYYYKNMLENQYSTILKLKSKEIEKFKNDFLKLRNINQNTKNEYDLMFNALFGHSKVN